ncbi:MAG: hypothetical protein H0U45_03950 [Tatlockia sp.]|nr:hypothetical protein [Tatlockia sp.]
MSKGVGRAGEKFNSWRRSTGSGSTEFPIFSKSAALSKPKSFNTLVF